MIQLHLPYPPSANKLWRHIMCAGKPRTLLSNAGRKYYAEVDKMMRGRHPTQSGRLTISIDVYPPDRRRRDLDNVQKAVLDSLTKAGVWGDDSQIDDLHIKRKDVMEDGMVIVSIHELRDYFPS